MERINLHYVSYRTHIQYMTKMYKMALKYTTRQWRGYGNGSGSFLLCNVGLCVQYHLSCLDSSLTDLVISFGLTVYSML
jgi:hypothetical protein